MAQGRESVELVCLLMVGFGLSKDMYILEYVSGFTHRIPPLALNVLRFVLLKYAYLYQRLCSRDCVVLPAYMRTRTEACLCLSRSRVSSSTRVPAKSN